MSAIRHPALRLLPELITLIFLISLIVWKIGILEPCNKEYCSILKNVLFGLFSALLFVVISKQINFYRYYPFVKRYIGRYEHLENKIYPEDGFNIFLIEEFNFFIKTNEIKLVGKSWANESEMVSYIENPERMEINQVKMIKTNYVATLSLEKLVNNVDMIFTGFYSYTDAHSINQANRDSGKITLTLVSKGEELTAVLKFENLSLQGHSWLAGFKKC